MPSYAESVRALSVPREDPRGVSLYARRVNRPLGSRLAAAAHQVGLTPNGVTTISAAFAFGAIALIALVRPGVWLGVAVAVMLVLAYAFDSADGQLARLTGRASVLGEWFDHVVDAVKHASLHMAVIVGWYRFGDVPSDAWLLVPVVYTVLAVLIFSAGTLTDVLTRIASLRAGAPAREARPRSLLRSLLLLPVDTGILSLAFLTYGWPPVFRWVYLLLAAALLVVGAALMVRWVRLLGSLS